MSNTQQVDLIELRQRIQRFCSERNWDQFHNPKDLAISLVLEATEVLEHFQWKSDQEVLSHVNEHRDAIAEEVVDVLYWVIRLADKLGIDLGDAFEQKNAKE